ncbi:potassium channel family protein [Brucella haematophila]|uniref:Two pore domain potassium channel family protein n=1 Tax=Brucella haematophila TaxID=419474 RepID=A0ABX1DLW0_9HYPH|nr:potassium channel family protein [Brucella haematophila]NKC03945.1 two pore domain potassium channel family protein [Brucella haematophila]TMV00826.1 two pore domain potassium channel family protein [Brucella haematophila]
MIDTYSTFLANNASEKNNDGMHYMFLIFWQLCFGSFIGLINVILHALATIIVIKVTRQLHKLLQKYSMLALILTMSVAASILLATQVIEIIMWSLSYIAVSAIASGADGLYFAFVNFTSLGYGDIVPLERWHLMGPMTAMNGVLLFGWSTAVLFQVLTFALQSQKPQSFHSTPVAE